MSKKHRFVICNPDLCIACNMCMKKCVASAYQRGRLSASRLDVLKLSKTEKMPNQCRQCDDAPCVNVCPTSALRFGKTNIELIEEICIACKLCTLACPYGAIHMDAQKAPNLDMGEVNLELACFNSLKSTAVKCDLCDGSQEGYACVGSCPKGALVMVNPEGENVYGKKLKDSQSMDDFLACVL